MEKKTVRQFSLLGLILMGASALTAAVVPTKAASDQSNTANNGKAAQFSNDNAAQAVLSCVLTEESPLDCHITVGTVSSGAGLGTRIQTAGGRRFDTNGNTSASNPADGFDTTSQLVQVA